MSPAADKLLDVILDVGGRPALEDVLNVARVALQVALEGTEQLLHELLRVLPGVGEQHVVAVSNGGEEVALFADRPESSAGNAR